MADRPIIFSAPMVLALLAGTKSQTRRVRKKQDWPEAIVRRYPRQHGAGYEVGDRLYVRETIRAEWPEDAHYIRYVADQTLCRTPDQRWDALPKGRSIRSIHMPRWASRLTLTVTDVRVQQLQEISEADAVAEGCPGVLGPNPDFPDEWDPSPVEQYRDLWDQLNAARGYAWATNPWVVVVSFSVEHRNIDAEVR